MKKYNSKELDKVILDIPTIPTIRAKDLRKDIEVEVIEVRPTSYILRHYNRFFRVQVPKKKDHIRLKLGDIVVMSSVYKLYKNHQPQFSLEFTII